MSEWEDLEADWELLQKKSPITVVSNKPSDLRSQLELAGAKSLFELKTFAKKFDGQPFTAEVLAEVMAKTVALFMEKWHEGLRGQNLSGLIEIVLEGQDLSPEEMRGFLGALPDSLLQRILDSGIQSKSADGVHGLVAMERHLRARNIRDYRIGKDFGRVYVSFFEPKVGAEVRFFLDEIFELP